MGLKKFQCVQCPAKFVSKGNLTAHMSTHDTKKPYACLTCGSSFTQSYSLVKHNRIHTGERPFQCEFCEMRFYSSDHLKRHIRTHTGCIATSQLNSLLNSFSFQAKSLINATSAQSLLRKTAISTNTKDYTLENTLTNVARMAVQKLFDFKQNFEII